MPIRDQGYRRYQGRRGLHGRAWWVIARTSIAADLKRRRLVALLLFAWTPFLVRAVLIYAAANFPQASSLSPTAETFREFLGWQNVFVFFVTIFVGAGLIADGRRANALQIYLAKPLTRAEYVAGKLVVLFVFLGFVTWLPAVLLLALQVLFSGSTEFLRENLFLVPAITLFSVLQVLVSAFAILALSSLSPNRRFVAILYAGIIFFTAAMARTLGRITDSRAWAWLSPGDTLDVVADAIFRIDGARDIPVPLAAIVVATLIGVSVVVLERRVRGVEVVS